MRDKPAGAPRRAAHKVSLMRHYGSCYHEARPRFRNGFIRYGVFVCHDAIEILNHSLSKLIESESRQPGFEYLLFSW